MTAYDIPWRPSNEAPSLQPLLCYWAPFPEAEDPEGRPELWAVAVRRKAGSIDRWHMYQPLWEGGCGHPYDVEPDFYMPVRRPDGEPRWVYGYRDDQGYDFDPVVYLKAYDSTTPHKGGNSPESVREADADPQRIAASKAAMPRLGPERSTIPLKVDGSSIYNCKSGFSTRVDADGGNSDERS